MGHSPWGRKESDTTGKLNDNNSIISIHTHICMECDLAIKHNELIMPLSTTSMDLEMIILREGCQIEKDKEPRIPLMGRIEKSVQMNSDSQT